VIVSPLGVSISPTDWDTDRLSLVFLEVCRGRLRLVVRTSGDEGQLPQVIDLMAAHDLPIEEGCSEYLLPIWKYQPQQKGEQAWKR
jgi:hypothetical protein